MEKSKNCCKNKVKQHEEQTGESDSFSPVYFAYQFSDFVADTVTFLTNTEKV